MNVNQNVSLNLTADGIPPRLHMVQGDSNTRTIVASLWDDSQPYNVPASAVVMMRFRKPDGTGGLYDVTEGGAKISVFGNVVTIPVATQLLTVAGVVFAQVDVFGAATGVAAEKLATFRLAIEVAPSVYPDANIISSDYYNILTAKVAEAVAAADQAEQSQGAAAASAAAAATSAANAAASAAGAVKYNTPQTLTAEQQAQARDNINAPAPYEAGDNISIAGRIITTKAFPCNPNLLDNWYFGNPVNQRGQAEWLSSASVIVPCVDRWNWWGQYTAGSTLKLLSDGLQLIGPTGAPGLYQKISQKIEKDRLPVGATVTLSALVKADVNASIILSIGGQNYIAVAVQANVWELITYTLNAPSVEQTYDISIQRNTDGATFTVKAVKLEFGSQQTLAHKEGGVWVLNEIPKFGDQLAECQRYAVRIGNAGTYRILGTGVAPNANICGVVVPLPVEMRTIPVATLNGRIALTNAAGVNIYCTNVTVSAFGVGSIELACAASGLSPSAAYTAYLEAGNYLLLSADL